MKNRKDISAPAIHHNASRRLFIRQASAMSAMAGAGAPLALNLLAAGSAAAQSGTQDYKAIVCLFMFGGNDSFNTVLPTDLDSWNAYTQTRGQGGGSIGLKSTGTPPVASAKACSPERLGGVLNINAPGGSFALNPLLVPLQKLFNEDKRLAIVANIGPLIKPTNKDQYSDLRHPRPPRLFSHNDQQSIWQTFQGEGAPHGWGGRMADMMAGANREAVFTAVSAAGNTSWLTGTKVRQYQVGGSGALRLGGDSSGKIYNSTSLEESLKNIVRRAPTGSHFFEQDLAAVSDRSILAESMLRTSLPPPSNPSFGTSPVSGSYNPKADIKLQFMNPSTGALEFNPLAQQLQVVARLIAAGKAGTDVKRQLFFVSLGGFDTHSNQNDTHSVLLAKLAHAMSYFDTTLSNIGALNSVTTFTASDFGRSFTSNGDGTDHGWGGHQFVMGGAVNGGNIYGKFPTLRARTAGTNTFSSPDQLRNGSLLPTTSVDQLGATLGSWFGLNDQDKSAVFPNLKEFNPNLGFMKT